ncbi:uncharacterized protein FOMMEDRAFT_141779 [Fomitiporia mediterranea MF3/22]|uniref:uncharacterized protein n=1 Tax=Fomitiporia mediterranea (strain MF3/22) TaxID=694068 RepID=UPI0004409746|nr:uncharacterized protein FOMMEDRAFT_141779 [Fomitiporia mediterranea MF3/22]EJD01041.1 hypothetical protein FOMMEDRAFT_141779 [Fomitiporia mediterranea MF3/22]
MDDSKERDSRSMSHEFEESEKDFDLGKDNSSGRGKPGRKKNPDSAAARRDQNRIAQREFRLRKQQRIRDLEARVEILSGSKDETFNELRNVVKDLMQENQNLRNLIRSLGSYIGDGMGGILPSLGFERPQEFVEFMNRAETDTAFEGFQRRKKAAQAAAANRSATGSGINVDITRKRSASEDMSVRKRVKGLDEHDHLGLNGTGHGSKDSDSVRYPPMSVPISPATASNSFYPSTGRSTHEVGLFSELLQGQGGTGTASSMYMTGPSPDTAGYAPTTSSIASGSQYPSAFHPPINVTSALNSQPYLSTVTPNAPAPTPSSTASEGAEQEDGIDDPKLQEATKLISYHLDNYKRNNAYCLPQSLRPTLVQRTVPHESVIDGIPHPELRDRMILLRGRFDIVDALHEYAKSLTLHGDDVLAHNNWEIGESWLRRYGFLVEQPILNICNRWRRERGESELLLTDIQHAAPDLPATT